MRFSIYMPTERLSSPERLEKRLWTHYPIVSGEQRDVCELYNDGMHLYARRYVHKKPTSFLVWLPYRNTRPLVRYYVGSRRDVVNLKNPEVFRLYVDGHLGTTVLAMCDFGILGTAVRVQKYLVIPKGKTIKIDLRANDRRVNLVFTRYTVL